MYTRRLSVLLVYSEATEEKKPVEIGSSESFMDDSVFVDYVELLSASNIPFDIAHPAELSYENFISGDTINYTTVIFCSPLSGLTDSMISVIKEVSYKFGISLVSTYTNVDHRSRSFFGIENIIGKRFLWPLKTKIVRWPRDIYRGEVVASYGLISGFSGIRKRGLRKLALKQTLMKLIRLYSNLLLPYIKVVLKSDASILVNDMKDKPLAWSYQFGKGTNYFFALHEDLFLDKFNEIHRLVRASIEANSGFGLVSIDLENTMVLRLDDAGSCSTDYLNNRNILDEADWERISSVLEEKNIALSVVYTPKWVDDGDAESGTLFIDDKKIHERKPGTLYDSNRVKYVYTNNQRGAHDHASEYRGLKKLVNKRLVDVHSHGLTHLDPDYTSWSKDRGRDKDTRWYHEFYRARTGKESHKDEQLRAMRLSRAKILDLFDEVPCAFTPSGHRQSPDSDLLAYDSGYSLFSSEFTGISKENTVVRNWKIPTVFLYLKDPSTFSSISGYPFVGVFHDYEIKRHGVHSLLNIIKGWKSKDIHRFISLRDLTANLCLNVVGYWFEKEKKLCIQISLPANNGIDEPFSFSREIEIRLRINPPSEAEDLADNLSIVDNDSLEVQTMRECSASHEISLSGNISLKSSAMLLHLSLNKKVI